MLLGAFDTFNCRYLNQCTDCALRCNFSFNYFYTFLHESINVFFLRIPKTSEVVHIVTFFIFFSCCAVICQHIVANTGGLLYITCCMCTVYNCLKGQTFFTCPIKMYIEINPALIVFVLLFLKDLNFCKFQM